MSTTDTPKTDAAEQVIIQILVKWAKGEIYAEDMTVAVQHELRQLRTLERQNRELADALENMVDMVDFCGIEMPEEFQTKIERTMTAARAALTKAPL